MRQTNEYSNIVQCTRVFVKLNKDGKTYDLYREAYNCYTEDDLLGKGLTKAELYLEYMMLMSVITEEQFNEMIEIIK